MAANRAGDKHRLHYLEANRVEHMAGVEVCTDRNEKLGSIDGFLIERDTRRLRYFVVEPEASNRRCILTADTPAVLDVKHRKLRVDADSNDLEQVDARSGEDVVDALDRNSAA